MVFTWGEDAHKENNFKTLEIYFLESEWRNIVKFYLQQSNAISDLTKDVELLMNSPSEQFKLIFPMAMWVFWLDGNNFILASKSTESSRLSSLSSSSTLICGREMVLSVSKLCH